MAQRLKRLPLLQETWVRSLGRASGHARPDIKYVDGTDTFDGPARGYAPGGWKVFEPRGLPKWRGAKSYNSSLWELSRFSGGRVQGKHAVPTNRVGGADIPLTDAMKSDVRRYLEETRQNGGIFLPFLLIFQG